jgi:hypothetical protein
MVKQVVWLLALRGSDVGGIKVRGAALSSVSCHSHWFPSAMVPFSISELQSALSTRQDLVYITFGALIVSVGLHYASKVNRVSEGEPPLLPGALPVFGHALAFMKDTNKLYEIARYIHALLPF